MEWSYLYRAVDQHGQVIDVLLSLRRDLGGGTAVLHHVRCAPARSRPRSRPTARPSTRGSWTNCSPRPCTRRAVRKQPDRSRPRTTESPAPADARPEASPLSADPRHRSRLHAEPAPRPLRHRHRRARPLQAPQGLRRSRTDDLNRGEHLAKLAVSRSDRTTQQCPTPTS